MGKHSADGDAKKGPYTGKHRAGDHGSTAQMVKQAQKNKETYDRLVAEARGEKK